MNRPRWLRGSLCACLAVGMLFYGSSTARADCFTDGYAICDREFAEAMLALMMAYNASEMFIVDQANACMDGCAGNQACIDNCRDIADLAILVLDAATLAAQIALQLAKDACIAAVDIYCLLTG